MSCHDDGAVQCSSGWPLSLYCALRARSSLLCAFACLFVRAVAADPLCVASVVPLPRSMKRVGCCPCTLLLALAVSVLASVRGRIHAPPLLLFASSPGGAHWAVHVRCVLWRPCLLLRRNRNEEAAGGGALPLHECVCAEWNGLHGGSVVPRRLSLLFSLSSLLCRGSVCCRCSLPLLAGRRDTGAQYESGTTAAEEHGTQQGRTQRTTATRQRRERTSQLRFDPAPQQSNSENKQQQR